MGAFRIEWKSSALKELKRIDRKVISRILEGVEALAVEPLPPGVRKLAGADRTYRIRIGDYRVIYQVLAESVIIQIIRVRHRREAYR